MPRKDDIVQVQVSLPGEQIAQMNKDARTAYRLLVGGWTFTGFLAIIVCVGFYVHPENTSALNHNLVGPWDDIWHIAWALGGLLIMIGTLRVRYVIELYGNIIFCACLVPYTVAVVEQTGLNVPAFGLSLGAFVLGIGRIAYIVKFARRLTIVVHEQGAGE